MKTKRQILEDKLRPIVRKLIKENNMSEYNTDLNTIFEDQANKELIQKLSPSEYNAFLKH